MRSAGGSRDFDEIRCPVPARHDESRSLRIIRREIGDPFHFVGGELRSIGHIPEEDVAPIAAGKEPISFGAEDDTIDEIGVSGDRPLQVPGEHVIDADRLVESADGHPFAVGMEADRIDRSFRGVDLFELPPTRHVPQPEGALSFGFLLRAVL